MNTVSIETLDLPRHTHALVLTGRDRATGIDLHAVIVWADRVYDRCPQCGQPVNREVDECPVLLDAVAGGVIEDVSQQHGCGFWMAVGYTEVKPGETPEILPETCEDGPEHDHAELLADLAAHIDTTEGLTRILGREPDMVAPDVTAAQVLAAAKELSDSWDRVAASQRAKIKRDLAQELRLALAAIAEPLVEDETTEDRIYDVSSGSEERPGVYRDDDGNWQAWDYDPSIDGETITVYAEDLKAATQ